MIVNVELYSFLRFPISQGKKSLFRLVYVCVIGAGVAKKKSESLK